MNAPTTFQREVAGAITAYFTMGGVSSLTQAQLMKAHGEAYALTQESGDAHAVATEIVFRINGVNDQIAEIRRRRAR